VARLEDAGANENGLGAELHHERGVRRGRDPTRREVGDRELPGPRHAPDQLVGRAEVLGLGHQLLGRERREASDSRGDRAHVPHGLHDVARARLALGADHRRALADAPERLAQVACAADKRDAEGELIDVEMLVRGVRTSDSSMKSTPSASRIWASTKWPIRALAITGIETVFWISLIFVTEAIRATPPSLRISAGTRSSAITEAAPASSAIFACSAVVTSMITPPLSISAR